MADVTLPSLGESVTEGIITQWIKKVGDVVARDEPLFEVSTDKVDSEMPSPAAGVLVEIIAEEGDTVETGSRVAIIDESATPTRESGAPEAPGAPSPASTSAPAPEPAASQAPAVAPSVPAPTPTSPVAVSDGTSGVVVSPVVRRILNDGDEHAVIGDRANDP